MTCDVWQCFTFTAHTNTARPLQVLPDRGKGVGVQLAAKGQVCRSSATVFPFLCVTVPQFNDLPPEVRPFKPDQNLKAELKASSAPGFDMAIGQVGMALRPRSCVER